MIKENYDVVIAGAGASGFVAAYEASKKGLKVLLLEKGRHTGGSGNYMGGAFAVESPLQKKMGISLTKKEALQEELNYSHYRADTKTLKNYINASADNIKWLQNLGQKFKTVYKLGNSFKTWHLFEGGGKSLIHDVLEPKALANGVDLQTSTSVEKVNLDEAGAVTSVVIRVFQSKKTKTIKTKALILATGGYLNNHTLMEKETNYPKHKIIPVNSGKNTGDGLKIAWAVGAQKYNMGTAMLFGGYLKDPTQPSYIYRYSQLNIAADQEALLWVNQKGDRFVNEEVVDNFAFSGNALLTQNKVFTILDENEVERLTQKIYKPAGTFPYPDDKLPNLKQEIIDAQTRKAPFLYQAASIADLAHQTHLPHLNDTVNRYNQLAQNGLDTDFGKNISFMHKITQGPFYALELGVGAFCTMGGLQVDLNNHVLDKLGNPISGLFAIGNDGAGNIVGDTYGITLPGTEAGWVIYSGKHTADYLASKL